MKLDESLRDEKLLEADALDHLHLGRIDLALFQVPKLSKLKKLLDSIYYYEHDGKPKVQMIRSLSYTNEEVISLAFIESLKDFFIEALLTQVFLMLSKSTRKFKIRFFKLANNEETDQELKLSKAEQGLVLDMEKFFRQKYFEMMNMGRNSICFLIIEFDQTLIMSVQASRANAQLSIKLLDQGYEEIRIKLSSQQAIVHSS